MKKLTTEQFIEKARKVCIICHKHGEFWQLPQNHLKGCGCHLNHGKRVWRNIINNKELINVIKNGF